MDLGSSGQFRASGATLGDLLMQAYHVESFQIAGGPSWINSARFEITAAADSKPLTPDQRREMLQNLLADRFQVVLHRETKELPVYELILAKGGPKLKQAAAGKCPDPPEMTNPCGGFRIFRRSLLTGNQVTVAQLAQDLSFMLDRLVIDKTAIKGIFDMRLEWTPEATLGRISSEGEPAGSPDGPSIFTAIQEQLGLKLESRRGPTPVLVLDRASKPSDN
jgi:uncharacterized protein (TIGR03435 family)